MRECRAETRELPHMTRLSSVRSFEQKQDLGERPKAEVGAQFGDLECRDGGSDSGGHSHRGVYMASALQACARTTGTVRVLLRTSGSKYRSRARGPPTGFNR